MNQEKLLSFLTGKSIQIPSKMLLLRKVWKLEWNDFIMLMYLKDKGKEFLLNPKEIAQDLSLSIKEVMLSIGILQDAHLVRMNTVKSDKGMMEDYLSLEDFYHKYMEYILEEVNEKNVSNSTIFGTIEQEFGRTLSPMELEIIKAWLDEGFQEEMIEEAIKEAVFNGVTNLRYIDKILYEWDKKGIKTRKDVEKRNVARKKEETPVEVFEYNWFEDDDIDE